MAMNASSSSIEASDYLVGPGGTPQSLVCQHPRSVYERACAPRWPRFASAATGSACSTKDLPAELADDIKKRTVSLYTPTIVTVIVTDFAAPYSQRVRVVGEAAGPKT